MPLVYASVNICAVNNACVNITADFAIVFTFPASSFIVTYH